jgi:hypothetical protein
MQSVSIENKNSRHESANRVAGVFSPQPPHHLASGSALGGSQRTSDRSRMKLYPQLFDSKKAATARYTRKRDGSYIAPADPLTRSGSMRGRAYKISLSSMGLALQRGKSSRLFDSPSSFPVAHAPFERFPTPNMASADSCPITLHVATQGAAKTATARRTGLPG